jgi:hypothetical protein
VRQPHRTGSRYFERTTPHQLFGGGVHHGRRGGREDDFSAWAELREGVLVGQDRQGDMVASRSLLQVRKLGADVGTYAALANMPSVEEEIDGAAARPRYWHIPS